MANEQTGYKDVNPFYQHINWLLEEEARKKWKYNDIVMQSNIDPRTQQLINLEDWFMTLETLYHRVRGLFTTEDDKLIEDYIKKIDNITKGDNFATAHLTDLQMIDIRSICRALSKDINKLMWDYKVHVDVKPTKRPGMVW